MRVEECSASFRGESHQTRVTQHTHTKTNNETHGGILYTSLTLADITHVCSYSSLFSSLFSGVSRAFRLINTIASVHVVSLRPTCFCINFKADSRKDSPIVQSREYETETKMECAEVVAKLRFLISHAQPDTFPTGPSLANTGLLAQSIK